MSRAHEQEHEPDLTPQERELERMLATALPARTELRLERIEAEAARRRLARQLWTWRGIAAVLVVGLGVSLVLRPQPPVVERLVEVPVEVAVEVPVDRRLHLPPPPPTIGPFLRPTPARPIDSPDSYIMLRELVLEHGLDALPARPLPGPAGPALRVSDVVNGLPGGDV